MSYVSGDVRMRPVDTLFSTTLTWSAGATTAGAIVSLLTGGSIYITDLQLTCLTACTWTLREDTSTVVVLQGAFNTNGGIFTHSFRQPIKLTADKPLQGTTSEKLQSINVQGYKA